MTTSIPQSPFNSVLRTNPVWMACLFCYLDTRGLVTFAEVSATAQSVGGKLLSAILKKEKEHLECTDTFLLSSADKGMTLKQCDVDNFFQVQPMGARPSLRNALLSFPAVQKTGGADYVNVLGTKQVKEGKYQWNLLIINHNGNMRLGVAHNNARFKGFPHVYTSGDKMASYMKGKWFMRSPGNASDKQNRADGIPFATNKHFDLRNGDLVNIKVDMTAGTIEWHKNGKLAHLQKNLRKATDGGGVSLLVSSDYNNEYVALLSLSAFRRFLRESAKPNWFTRVELWRQNVLQLPNARWG